MSRGLYHGGRDGRPAVATGLPPPEKTYFDHFLSQISFKTDEFLNGCLETGQGDRSHQPLFARTPRKNGKESEDAILYTYSLSPTDTVYIMAFDSHIAERVIHARKVTQKWTPSRLALCRELLQRARSRF